MGWGWAWCHELSILRSEWFVEAEGWGNNADWEFSFYCLYGEYKYWCWGGQG